MTRIRVVLEYFHPWPNSSGFHVASAQGWYRELGLDVDLRVFDPLVGDSLEHLVRGDAELAVFPSNRLLVRRELGRGVRGIAAINQRALETIQTTASTGIRRPAELAGRGVALNPTPRGLALLRHLVALDGGDPDAIEIVDSGVRELSATAIAARRRRCDVRWLLGVGCALRRRTRGTATSSGRSTRSAGRAITAICSVRAMSTIERRARAVAGVPARDRAGLPGGGRGPRADARGARAGDPVLSRRRSWPARCS